MLKKNYIPYIFAFFLCIISFVVLFPLLQPGFIKTDDAAWMVIRLTSFYQSLADGQFPVRFLGRLNQNYGYPVANFLYPGFLYLGSALHIAKIPFQNSVEIIMAGSVIAGAFGLFFWLQLFFGPLASFIGASTFLFSPYLLYDLYKRGSVGELLATGVAMLTLFIVEKRWRILVPFCIFILLISHNTLALVFSLFFFIYIVVKKEFSFLVPMAIGVMMSSFFWIPAFFERSFVRFNELSVSNPFDFFGISFMLFYTSIPFLLGLIYMVVHRKKEYTKENWFFIITFLVAGFFALPISGIFWKLPILSQFFQFPYRWYALWLIVGPWLVGSMIESFREKEKFISIAVIGVICVLTSYGFLTKAKSEVHEEGYYTTNEATTTVADEYMPKWVIEKPEKRSNEKLEFFDGRGVFLNTEISTKKIVTKIKAEEDSIIQINTVFYPGWGATLDGKPVEVSGQNPRGLMHILVPKGEHLLFVEFRETVFRFIADVLSAIGFITYGIFILLFLLHGKFQKHKSISYLKDVWS